MIERLEQLEKAATRDWRANPVSVPLGDTGDYECCVELVGGAGLIASRFEGGLPDIDQVHKCLHLAAAARNALPALLSVARAAESIIRMVSRHCDIEDDDEPRWVALRDALAQLKEANDG